MKRFKEYLKEGKKFSSSQAKEFGDQIGVDWKKVDIEQFRRGLEVESEHGSQDPQTNVTNDDPIKTAKIALAHLKELPDYYSRLQKMEMSKANEEYLKEDFKVPCNIVITVPGSNQKIHTSILERLSTDKFKDRQGNVWNKNGTLYRVGQRVAAWHEKEPHLNKIPNYSKATAKPDDELVGWGMTRDEIEAGNNG